MPSPPTKKPIPDTWQHRDLHRRVIDALVALPGFFESDMRVVGVQAPDLHTMALPLGAGIEDKVVETLNHMRAIWDPDEKYGRYSFVRQPQTFPDVLLTTQSSIDDQRDIIMGLELKGWYLLSKEREGSFRYVASPTASNPWDLIVVVPWVFEHVTSGKPKIFTPYIESSLYAAEYRNWHWQYVMKNHEGEKGKIIFASATPYPGNKKQISDRAIHDSGGNFGRIFRTGLMDNYVQEMSKVPVLGISAAHWQTFFKVVEEAKTSVKFENAMAKLRTEIEQDPDLTTEDEIESTVDMLRKFYFEVISRAGK